MNADSKSDQDRWRELADLLGLPAEGNSPPAPAAFHGTILQPPPRLEPVRAVPAPPRDEAPSGAEGMSPPQDSSAQEGLAEIDMPETIPEEPREEVRPRRGRRGRGRQASTEDAAGTGATEISSSAPGLKPDEDEDRPSRGRRGRRKSTRPDVAGTESETPSEFEEEDLSDDYAKWNLPSWEELIASLKRP